jgi:hypothetical protein
MRTAEFSLPASEIDIRANDKATDASVPDQDFQVVPIQADLAREVGALTNARRLTERTATRARL